MQQDKTKNPLHECTAHIEGEKAINENYPPKAQTLGKLKGVKKRKKKRKTNGKHENNVCQYRTSIKRNY